MIPTLALLEITFRMGMKIRRRKVGVAGEVYYHHQSQFSQSLSGHKKMHSATISFRKYISKQTLARLSSQLAARKLTLRYHMDRLNFSIRWVFV
jgi:hypothetical protein